MIAFVRLIWRDRIEESAAAWSADPTQPRCSRIIVLAGDAQEPAKSEQNRRGVDTIAVGEPPDPRIVEEFDGVRLEILVEPTLGHPKGGAAGRRWLRSRPPPRRCPACRFRGTREPSSTCTGPPRCKSRWPRL